MMENAMNNKKNIPVLFKKKKDCCGCTACYTICPMHAIVMEYDTEGFYYPKIDSEKCIKCYRCHKVCPISDKEEITM